ncbi:hypothetical protein KA005_73825 [bacterium]|nr:hypothetical protein [bacterium]
MKEEILLKISSQLEDIQKILAIQTIPVRKQALEIVKKECLTTPVREKMFKLIDGKNSMADIAKKVKVSSEGVRLLLVELEELGVIEMKKTGRTKYPVKLI